MFISEITFPHLQAAHEAQLTRDLERRRVAADRLERNVWATPRLRDRAAGRGGRGVQPTRRTGSVATS